MGADITHGVTFEKKQELIGGNLVAEIIPVDGGYDGVSYSTVQAAVEYAQSLGVHPDLWPIYYGVGDSDIDIDEVNRRCEMLTACFSELPMDAVSGHYLLKR